MQQLFSEREHSSPIYLTLQLRFGSGGFYSKNWEADTAPDNSVRTTEKGSLTQYPLQALVTTTANTPPIKGTRTSIHRGKIWQASYQK